MIRSEREKIIEQIELLIANLDNITIFNDFTDDIDQIITVLDYMIDNENNENHRNRDSWESLKELLFDFQDSINEVDIDFQNSLVCTIGPYNSTNRKKVIQLILQTYNGFVSLVKDIENKLETLRDECQEVSENSDKPGFLEEYKIDADNMIDIIDDLKVTIEPHLRVVRILEKLSEYCYVEFLRRGVKRRQ